MSQVICRNCGAVNDYHTEQRGPHIAAFCNGCNKYIKFLPQNKVKDHFSREELKKMAFYAVQYAAKLQLQGQKVITKEEIDFYIDQEI